MPIYEYRCTACGHELEALQKISDAPLKKCPECSRRKLERLMSAPAFRLKGGGWYETDFKSDSETKRNLVETAERKEPAAAESGKTDGAKGESGGAKTDGAKTDGAKTDGAKTESAKADGATKPASAKNGAKETKPAAKASSVKPATKSSPGRRAES
jgi:putative FmdB family regulatory protein